MCREGNRRGEHQHGGVDGLGGTLQQVLWLDPESSMYQRDEGNARSNRLTVSPRRAMAGSRVGATSR